MLTTKIIIDMLNLLIKTDQQERKVYEGMLSMQAYLDGKLEAYKTCLQLVERLDAINLEEDDN